MLTDTTATTTDDSAPMLARVRGRACWTLGTGSRLAILALLIMKIGSNMFDSRIKALHLCRNANDTANSTWDDESVAPFNRQCVRNDAVIVAVSTVGFLMPTIGGVLSDGRIGIFGVLWIDTASVMCVNIALMVLAQRNITRELPPSLSINEAKFPGTYNSMGDTMLLYTPMLFARDNTLMLTNLYFITSGLGVLVGALPSILGYATRKGYEFIGVIFGCVNIVSMLALHCISPAQFAINRGTFRLPNARQFVRFYMIAAGAIPYLVASSICLSTLYLQQFDQFSRHNGSWNVAASCIGLIHYAVTILVCACVALAASRGRIPAWFTLRHRIRVGLCLAIIAKLPLVVINLIDYYLLVNPAPTVGNSGVSFAFISVFPVCDGVADAMVIVAYYELVCCVADKNARATLIGVFYTVWPFTDLLGWGLLSALSQGDSDPLRLDYAFVTAVCLIIIAFAYWEKISWPLAEKLLHRYELEVTELESAAQVNSEADICSVAAEYNCTGN